MRCDVCKCKPAKLVNGATLCARCALGGERPMEAWNRWRGEVTRYRSAHTTHLALAGALGRDC